MSENKTKAADNCDSKKINTTAKPVGSSDLDVREMTKMAMCVALICVSAYISFPVPLTPGMVTAVTAAAGVTAFILTPKQTAIVIGIWVVLGAIGVPVYIGGAAGLGKLLGPVGGYIWGFLIAYPAVSFLKGKNNSFKRFLLVNILVGMPLTDLPGVIQMMLVMDVDVYKGLMMGVVPYIPGDIIKAAMAAFIAVKLNTIMPKA